MFSGDPQASSQLQIVTNKATPLLVNFYGEYGKHFTDSQCMVCNKTINRKYNLVQHLQSSNHCKNIISKLDIDKKLEQLFTSNFTALSDSLKKHNQTINTTYTDYQQFWNALTNIGTSNNDTLQIDINLLFPAMTEQDVSSLELKQDEIQTNQNNSDDDEMRNMSVNSTDRVSDKKLQEISRTALHNRQLDINTRNSGDDKDHSDITINKVSKSSTLMSLSPGSLARLPRGTNRNASKMRDVITFRCKTIDQIFKALNEHDDLCDITVYSRAIQKCSKQLHWDECLQIANNAFVKNKQRTIAFYGILFNSAAENDKIIDVYPKYFDKMVNQDKIAPNDVIFNQLLKGCKKRGNIDIAKKIWNMFDEFEIEKDSIAYSSMICVCGKANELEMAEKIFLQCNSPNRFIINSFLDAIASCRDLKKFEKYQTFAFDNNLIIQYKDYRTIMSAYLKFKQPKRALKIFNKMIDNGISQNHLCLDLTQIAYFQLQKKYFQNQAKLDKCYIQVTQTIPSKMMSINKNGKKLGFNHVLLIIRSILHYYGQTRWYQSLNLIENVINKHNFSFWLFDKMNKQWVIDLHFIQPEVVTFALRYIFVKNKSFIIHKLNHDIIIVTGKGAHRQGHRKSSGFLASDVVENEIAQWNCGDLLKLKNCAQKKGRLFIKHSDVVTFFAKQIESDKYNQQQQFLNQVTDTCARFSDGWTETVV